MSKFARRRRPSGRSAPAASPRPRRTAFAVEQLETRDTPTTFTWTGLSPSTVKQWSDSANWAGNVGPTGNPAEQAELVFPNLGLPVGDRRLTAQNDILGGVFSSISYGGSNYRLTGNSPITLGPPGTSARGSVVVADGAVNNTLNIDTTLGAASGVDQTFRVGNGGGLTVTAKLFGTTGSSLVKDGTGTLTLANDNSGFTGPVRVVDAGGRLVIGHRFALGTSAVGTSVGADATLGLQNVSGAITEPLRLNGLGVGNLGALNNLSGNTVWAGPIALDADAALGSERDVLIVTGSITDAGAGYSLTKEGVAEVWLRAANTYRGMTFVNNGILSVGHPLALGAAGSPSNGTLVSKTPSAAGQLRMADPTGFGLAVVDEELTLNGFGIRTLDRPGALQNTLANNTWAGPVILGSPAPLGSDVAIGAAPGTDLTISGRVRSENGTYSLLKVDTGRVVLSNDNAYTGTTLVVAGTLTGRDSNALGRVDADQSEVQQFVLVGTTGTFTLTFEGETTLPLPAAATADDVKKALEDLPSIGAVGGLVTVTKTLSGNVTTFTVAFGGALASSILQPIVVLTDGGLESGATTTTNGSAAPARSEVQKILLVGTQGTFRVTFSHAGFTDITPALPGDIPASGGVGPNASLQNALNALTSINRPGLNGSVTVTSTLTEGIRTFVVTFGGALANTDVEPLIVRSGLVVTTGTVTPGAAGTNEVQQAVVTGTAGTFRLRFRGVSTGPLPFNATDVQVQNALNALATIGGVGGTVTVTRTEAGDVRTYTITFGGNLQNLDVEQITSRSDLAVGAAALVEGFGTGSEVQELHILDGEGVGPIRLQIFPPRGPFTVQFPATISADDLEVLLNAPLLANNLPNPIAQVGGRVTVRQTPLAAYPQGTVVGRRYTIIFGGGMAGRNIPQMKVEPEFPEYAFNYTVRDGGAAGTIVEDRATLEFEVEEARADLPQTDPQGRNLNNDSVTGLSAAGDPARLAVTEPISLYGRGVNYAGALRNVSGTNTLLTPVFLGSDWLSVAAIGSEPDATMTPTADYFTKDYSLTVSGVISGPDTVELKKRGAGHLILPAANTYEGKTTIEQGWVTVQNNNALGGRSTRFGQSAQPRTEVFNGAALHLRALSAADGPLTVAENLTLSGVGPAHQYALIGNRGALVNLGGANAVTSDVALKGAVGIGVEQIGTLPYSDLAIEGEVNQAPSTFTYTWDGGTQEEQAFVIETGRTSGRIQVAWDFGLPEDFGLDFRDRLTAYYPPRNPGPGVLIPGSDTGFVDGPGGYTITYGPGAGTSTQVEFVVNEGNKPDRGFLDGFLTPDFWTFTATVLDPVDDGIIKFGSGRLSLQGPGSYDGAVEVRAGTLRAQNDTALGRPATGTAFSQQTYTPTTTTVSQGAVLEMGETVGRLNGGQVFGVQVWDEALVLGGPAQQVAVAGPAAAVFRLRFKGLETGDLRVDASAATVQAALQALVAGDPTVGTVAVTRSGNIFTVVFGNTRTAEAAVPLLAVVAVPGSPAEAVVSGGNASLISTTGDNAWRGTVSLTRGERIDTRGNSRLLLLGAVDDAANAAPAGSDLIKRGTGELLLGGTNTFRGTTVVENGTITAMNPAAFGATTGGTEVLNDAQVQLQGSFVVAGEALALRGTGLGAAQNVPARWLSVGPAPTNNGVAPVNLPTTGRIISTATDPTDPNVTYAATAGGGAWKTKDGGLTWVPLFDQLNLPGARVETVADGTTIRSEVQRVVLDGQGGAFTLTFNGAETAVLMYDATADEVRAALLALPTIGAAGGALVVSRTVLDDTTTFEVTFGGTLALTQLAPMVARPALFVSPTATTVTDGSGFFDEVQQFQVAGEVGAFRLTFRGQTTRALPYNAEAVEVIEALNALSTIGGAGGTAAVSRTRTRGVSTYTVAFGAALRNTNVEPLTGSTAAALDARTITQGGPGVNEVQELVLVGDGSFQVTFNGATTASLPNGITAAGLAAAINALPTVGGPTGVDGGVTVTRTVVGSTSTYRVTFNLGILGNFGVPQLVLTATRPVPKALAYGGSFAIAPSDPRVVYFATGDPTGADSRKGITDSYAGSGVYKSTDAGATWTLLAGYDGKNPLAGQAISKIVVDPDQPDIVYAASSARVGSVANLRTGRQYRITFGGTLQNLDIEPLEVTDTGPVDTFISTARHGRPARLAPNPPRVGNSETQLLKVFGDNGTFRLTFRGQTTAPIPVGASNGVVAGALNALLTIGGVGGFAVVAPAAGVPNDDVALPTPGVWRFLGEPGGDGAWDNITDNDHVSPNRTRPTGLFGQAPYVDEPQGVGPPGTVGPDDDYRVTFPQENASWSDLHFNFDPLTGAKTLFAALGESDQRNYVPPANTNPLEDPVQQAVRNGVYHADLTDLANTNPYRPDRYDPPEKPRWDYGVVAAGVDSRPTGQGAFPLGAPDAAGRNGYIRMDGSGPTVWAVVTQRLNPNVFLDLQFTTSNGAAWTAVTTPPPNLFGPLGQEQGRYDLAIEIDPVRNRVYLAGRDRLFYTIDNGTNWIATSPDARGGGPARFIHDLELVEATGEILVSTDGGLWRFDPATGLFDNANGSMGTTQLFSADAHPTDLTRAFAGARANGTQRFDNSTVWRRVDDTGTETTAVRYDARNPQTVYAVSSGQLRKSVNGGTTWAPLTAGVFVSGLVVDPVNPSRVLIGGDTVRESVSGGLDLRNLGAPVTAAKPATVVAAASYQGTFQYDPGFPAVTDKLSNTYDPDTIYVTDGTSLYVTKVGGSTTDPAGAWKARTPIVAGGATITDVAVDPSNRDTVYVAVSHPLGVAGGRVYRSTDAGQTWTDITGTADPAAGDVGPLPLVPTWKLVVDPRPDATAVYVGNDAGVWRLNGARTADNRSLTWTRIGAGMPDVGVRDLVVNQTLNTITAATYGRGAFQLFLPDPYPSVLPPEVDREGALRAVSGAASWTGPITLDAAGGPVVTIGTAGSQNILNGVTPATLNLLGPISGPSGVTLAKVGQGTLTLSGANTYAGQTDVRNGVLQVNNPTALGSTAGDTVVRNGTTLEIRTDVANEAVTAFGRGTLFNNHYTGAVRNTSGNNVFTGRLTIATIVGELTSTIGVDSGTSLTIVAGPGEPFGVTDGDANLSLEKELPGTLILASANGYDGLTTVAAGTLEVRNALALGPTTQSGGTLVLDGSVLRIAGGTRIAAEPLTLSGTGINRSGALQGGDGDNAYAGPITLAFRPNSFPPTSPASQVAFGAPGASDRLTVEDDLAVESPDRPGGITTYPIGFGLAKVGLGTVTLANVNAYEGVTTVEAGTLRVRNNQALGTAPTNAGSPEVQTVTVIGSAGNFQLSFNGVSTGDLAVGASGFNVGDALEALPGIGAGNVQVLKADILGGAVYTVYFRGGLAATPVPQLVGTPASNPSVTVATVVNYDPARPLGTVVSAGATLELDASGPNGSLTLNEVLTVNGNGVGGQGAVRSVGGLNTYAAVVTLGSDAAVGADLAAVLRFTGEVKDSASQPGATLRKVGAGTVQLDAVNTYTGLTVVDNGVLKVTRPEALGNGPPANQQGTVVNAGGTLQLAAPAGTLFGNEPLTIRGQGYLNQGALTSASTDNRWTRPVVLGANASFGAAAAGDTLTLTRPTTDEGNKYNVDIRGLGTVRYAADADNQYTGTTTVRSGTLALDQVAGLALVAPVVVGDGAADALLREDRSNQIGNAVTVQVNARGVFDLNGQADVVGPVTVTDGGVVRTGANGTLTLPGAATATPPLTGLALTGGRVEIGTGGTVVLNGNLSATSTATRSAEVVGDGSLDLNFDRNLVPSRAVAVADGPQDTDLLVTAALRSTDAGRLTKGGAGRLTLNPAAVPVNTTLVAAAGDVRVDSTIGPVEVAGAGASLSGAGTVGTLRGPNDTAVVGTVRPGTTADATAVLRAGSTLFGPQTRFEVDLATSAGGPVAGADYDRLAVNGPLALGGATLAGTVAPNIPVGTAFTVATAAGGVTGTLATPFGPGVVFLGGQKFAVSYADPAAPAVRDRVVLTKALATATVAVASSAPTSTDGQPVTFSVQVTAEAGVDPATLNGRTVGLLIDGVNRATLTLDATGRATSLPITLSGPVVAGNPAPGTRRYAVRVVFGDGATFETREATLDQDVERPTIDPLTGAETFVSPNNSPGTLDGFTASAAVTFERAAATYTAEVRDAGGALVRTLTGADAVVTPLSVNSARVDVTWDGKNTAGQFVGDGLYTVSVKLSDTYSADRGTVTAQVRVDNTSPQVAVTNPPPNFPRIAPGTNTRVLVATITEPNLTGWTVEVRNNTGGVVRTYAGTGTAVAIDFDGTNGAGATLPDGRYTLVLSAADAAGNTTTQPPVPVLVLAELPEIGGVTVAPVPPVISPDSPDPRSAGVRDAAVVTATVSKVSAQSATYRVDILNAGGAVVRTSGDVSAVIDAGTKTFPVSFTWTGKDGFNQPVPDGTYTARVRFTDEFGLTGESTSAPITVDNTPPTAGAVSSSARLIAPGVAGAGTTQTTLTATITNENNPGTWTLSVKNAAGVVVRTFQGTGLAVSAPWDGRDAGGAIVPDGTYRVELDVTDQGGNTATGAAGSVVVLTRPPAITLVSNTPTVYGQSITLTATATVPAGVSDLLNGLMVDFARGGTFLQSAPLALIGGVYRATVTVPTFAAGTYTDLTASTPGTTLLLPGVSAPATHTVTPATLDVRAGDARKVYGAAVPALTYQATGLVNGDTPAGVFTGAVATAATAASGVGAYPVTQGTLAANGNYTVRFTAGTLTVTPAPLVVRANSDSRIVGASNPPLTAAFEGLVNGDTPAVVNGLTLSTPATIDSRVGTYPVVVGGNPNAANYTITTVNGTLSVVPAPTDVTVGSGRGTPAGANVYRSDGSLKAGGLNPFPGFAGGVRVAMADFTRDGVADVVLATGPGTTARLVVLDGSTQAEIFSATPFDAFDKGLFVATGDIDGDGAADLVVTPDEGGGPRVVIYRGGDFDPVASYFGIDDPAFRGGARAAVGDINGDGFAEVVVSAGFGGGPRVSVWNGRGLMGGKFATLTSDFFAFETGLRNGTYASVGDVNGDGFGDLIIGAGPGGGPRVLVLDGHKLTRGPAAAVAAPLADFFAGNVANRGGVRVAAKYLDGDLFADLVTGPGEGDRSVATAYSGAGLKTGAVDALFDLPGFNDLNGVYVG